MKSAVRTDSLPSPSSTPNTDASAISAAASPRSSQERTVNVCGRSVIRRRIARKSPEAASRPAYDDQHSVGQSLDLLQDVRARRGSCGRPPPCAAAGPSCAAAGAVHAVERLVQQQDLRVVDQGAGDLTRWRMPLE